VSPVMNWTPDAGIENSGIDAEGGNASAGGTTHN